MSLRVVLFGFSVLVWLIVGFIGMMGELDLRQELTVRQSFVCITFLVFLSFYWAMDEPRARKGYRTGC